MNIRVPSFLFLAGLAATGCAGGRGLSPWPERSSLGADLPSFSPEHGSRRAKVDKGPITGEVTLKQALVAALLRNPALRAAAWEVRARQAEALQAALLPNPELDVSAESFGINRDLRGIRDMEVTASLSQLIWLGGDRARRRALADFKGREAGWEYEVRRVMVLTRTAQAFADLVALQDSIRLIEKRERLLAKILNLFEQRVATGHIAAKDLGLIRTQVRLERARLALARLRSRLVTARQRLAAMWGATRPSFRRARGRLHGRLEPPPLEDLLSAMKSSPSVRAWVARLRTAKASIALAKAVGVPDLTVSGGVRVLPASGSVGFVVGLSIPLPFFDRNQGAILAAKHRLRKAKQEMRLARSRLASRLVAAHQQASISATVLATLDEQLLPKAKLAVQTALESYQGGKSGYLGVLDAEEILLALQTERLEANRKLLLAYSEMELILGQPIRARASARENPHRGARRDIKQAVGRHDQDRNPRAEPLGRTVGKEGRK